MVESSPQAVLDSYRPGLVVVAVIALAGLLITLTGLRPGRKRPPAAEPSVVVAKSTPREAERVAVRD